MNKKRSNYKYTNNNIYVHYIMNDYFCDLYVIY